MMVTVHFPTNPGGCVGLHSRQVRCGVFSAASSVSHIRSVAGGAGTAEGGQSGMSTGMIADEACISSLLPR